MKNIVIHLVIMVVSAFGIAQVKEPSPVSPFQDYSCKVTLKVIAQGTEHSISSHLRGRSLDFLQQVISKTCTQKKLNCFVEECHKRPIRCSGKIVMLDYQIDVPLFADNVEEAREEYRRQCPEQGGYCDIMKCVYLD
jgi:hypothetical protein